MAPEVTMEEIDMKREFESIDKEVDLMIIEKRKELSFEIEENMTYYPELDKVEDLI